MKYLLIPLMLLAPPAMAQEEPSWEAKKAAFMQAYSPAPAAIAMPPLPRPIVRPDVRNEVDEQADLNMADLRKFARRANLKTDICARHHMRRVTTHRGWRCK